MNLTFDILGWTGAIFLLAAYAFVSNRLLSATSSLYQSLNAVGSLLLLTNNVFYGAFPSGFVNVVWGGIASIMVIRNVRTKDKT